MMRGLRAVACLALLGSAALAWQGARNPLGTYGQGGHRLWWLLFVQVHEARQGRGNVAFGQALLDVAAIEVAAGRGDARLTALVREASQPSRP